MLRFLSSFDESIEIACIFKVIRFSGNENMHDLTTNNGLSYELRVDLTDNHGLSLFAEYAYFAVEDEASRYRLILGEYANTSTVGK